MADFHFLQPQWLLLLIPGFLVLAYLRWRGFRQDNRAGQGVVAEHLAVHFRAENRSRHNYWPIYSAGLMATLLVVALAQPVWRQAVTPGQLGAPLLIAIDASQSMTKHDITPSRDARAHLLLNGLLDGGLNRPVGLVAVSGSSHVLLPPAVDTEIVRLYLSYLDPSVMPEDGGDLADLVSVLVGTPGLLTEGASLLLVTDGMSTGANELASMLSERSVDHATLALTDLGEQTANDLGGQVLRGDSLTPGDPRLLKLVRRLSSSGSDDGTSWRDEYRWFLIPVALFLLYWFRRGVTLYWAPLILLVSVGLNPTQARAEVADWFFTPDQQGALLLKLGRYKEAASRFDDPGWKGVACYYAEDWACARRAFGEIPTEDGIFNLATAAAQGGSYKLARDIYAALLTINPDYPQARANYEQVARIVEDINRMSESQQPEKPPPPPSGEPSDDIDPSEIADGEKEQAFGEIQRKTLSAEELLHSEEKTERWLRDISRNPKDFIRARFQYEYAGRSGGDES